MFFGQLGFGARKRAIWEFYIVEDGSKTPHGYFKK